jgi:hypothetical protein
MSKTKTVAKNTTTAVQAPKTAKDVPATIEFLKAQLAQLKGNAEEKISLDISYNGKNIKTVDTVSELLQISASLHARETAYKAEVVRYGLENANIQPFSEEKKSIEEWNKIIAKAIHELINSKQIQKIENAIKELSKHLDAETQLANTLASVMEGAMEFVK